ncbi:helix-turn-helix domain-containing protein [Rothia mucilaginosa]|uniref:helix-turn-helix domain-containing protein n=1 Tax=Rothia mucilaginosa TaxID=43675 RepID=UPI0026EAB501|nr:helix-turn-helix domain-containing protein [Rothia mucilaginosa]
MVFEAVKVALDPTPAQERLLLSHTGAARFAFNAGLAHVTFPEVGLGSARDEQGRIKR